MNKSRIVSYTSEELDELPDESDWATVLTDEEIEAAIASDPEETALGDDWIERGKITVRVNGKTVAARPRTGNVAVRWGQSGSAASGTVDIYTPSSNSEWGFSTKGSYGFLHPKPKSAKTSKKTTGELIYR